MVAFSKFSIYLKILLALVIVGNFFYIIISDGRVKNNVSYSEIESSFHYVVNSSGLIASMSEVRCSYAKRSCIARGDAAEKYSNVREKLLNSFNKNGWNLIKDNSSIELQEAEYCKGTLMGNFSIGISKQREKRVYFSVYVTYGMSRDSAEQQCGPQKGGGHIQ